MAPVESSLVKRRFFAEDLRGRVVELGQTEARHAAGVLRMKRGDPAELFDGAGTVARGVFEQLTARSAVVRLLEVRTLPARPEPKLEVAFAVPKGKRLDWVLAKATELGASRLSPVVFERSVVAGKMSEHARGRWRAICIAAAKQCGADFLPEIASPVALESFLAAAGGKVRLLGDTTGESTIPAALAQWAPGGAVTILVGPEGGLTEAERRAARKAAFTAVRLGQLVLRVETAVLAMLAAIKVLCACEAGPEPTEGFTNLQE